MSNRRNIQFTFTPHNKATLLDCNFIVDSANGNGFGARSLNKGGRISSLFMNTSATPGKASDGLTNPNPAAGFIVVNLQDNYPTYLGGFSGMVSPVTGSPISTGLTVGNPYVIISLGTTSLSQWQAAGLKTGITPAVGVSFIAAATSVAGTTPGTVKAVSVSGIDHIEVIGDAHLTNVSKGNIGGMQLILQCLKNGVVTAPTDGTVISLVFYMNDASQGV
jgi:hypothetical protein